MPKCAGAFPNLRRRAHTIGASLVRVVDGRVADRTGDWLSGVVARTDRRYYTAAFAKGRRDRLNGIE